MRCRLFLNVHAPSHCESFLTLITFSRLERSFEFDAIIIIIIIIITIIIIIIIIIITNSLSGRYL